MPATAKLPTRVPLSEVYRTLGISRATYYRHWQGVFTDYRTDGGEHRVAADELKEATLHTDPDRARGAVAVMRQRLGRTNDPAAPPRRR